MVWLSGECSTRTLFRFDLPHVVQEPNGFTITIAVSYWAPWVGEPPSGDSFELGNLSYNLFQFTDPAETKSFSFDTTFTNTVAAFGRAGVTPSSMDNRYNIVHPAGSFHLRDSRQLCSFHVVLNSSSRQPTLGSIHIDSISPLFSLAGHFVQDLVPDALNQLGFPVNAGGAACP